MKSRKELKGGKGVGREGERRGRQGGGERDVNDRDYWEIRRICQGNRL